MKLSEFLPYFFASCAGGAIYILLIYIFNPGYAPDWSRMAIKIVIIAAVMSVSIVFFKNKMGDKSKDKEDEE